MMNASENSSSLPVEDLQRKLEGAERLLTLYRRVLGHDLPNHLVSLQGLVAIIELEQRDIFTEEGQEYLRRLAGAARRVHEHVRALAEIGRVGRDAQPVEAVRLAEIAEEAAAEVRQLAPERPVDYHFPQAELILTLPRRMVRLLLVQLFRNAVQAAPHNRRVCIEVHGQVGATGQEFWVGDNGRGLSHDEQDRLRKFFAGGEALGGGLGLFLVRQIADAWGGRLQVESQPGRGSVFRVCVPAASSGS